jgi:hypothetical protein
MLLTKGGSDPRNTSQVSMSVALIITTLVIGMIAWLHERYRNVSCCSFSSSLSPHTYHNDHHIEQKEIIE